VKVGLHGGERAAGPEGGGLDLVPGVVDVVEGQPIVFGKVVINAEQFFAPFHGVRVGRNENRRSGNIIPWACSRDQRQQVRPRGGDWHLVTGKILTSQRVIWNSGESSRFHWAIGKQTIAVRAHIAEVAATFSAVGNGLVEVSRRNFSPPFLGVEKESPLLAFVVNAGDVHRAADGTAKIILLVRRPRSIEVVFGIEIVVADELV